MTGDTLAPHRAATMRLEFTITFYSRFRVGAAYPLDGLDAVADLREPLPADHVKGVMRAEAARLLEIASGEEVSVGGSGRACQLLSCVFGTARNPSPWHWSEVLPKHGWAAPELRSRVRIDEETGAAQRDLLVMASATFAESARFAVETESFTELGTPLDVQAALLRLAGRSVHHLGAWRRRGLGWVGLTTHPHQPDWEADWRTLTAHLGMGAK